MEHNSKKELILEGLNCANCAAKIENRIKNLDGINNVSLNFVNKKLTIEAKDKNNINNLLRQSIDIVNKIEPDVNVIVTTNKVNKNNIYINNENKIQILKIIFSLIIFSTAMIFKFEAKIEFSLYFLSFIICGFDVIKKSVKNILKGEIFDENFLMAIATIGAFSIKEFPEGAAVMLFYQVGEFFQDLAVQRSRNSIASLVQAKPEFANVKVEDKINKLNPEQVKIGDIILVKPGEKVPLDGVVLDGKSLVDTSTLTGESVPREIKKGSNVLSGFINKNGLLTIKVEREFKDSAVVKILELVENASGRKSKVENFITKFARYYTPIVVSCALLLAIVPPILMNGENFSNWIYRGLLFLVVSCPCALVISIPLGFFAGIGAASRNGILIKGSNFLEALNNVDTIVFDKTGTLTKGNFEVANIKSENGFDKDELLYYAALTEGYSNHPIANSIKRAYSKDIDLNNITHYEEVEGMGVRAIVNKREVFLGNKKLMKRENIDCLNVNETGTIMYLSIDKVFAGYIIIEDEIKKDTSNIVHELKKLNVKNIVMLTGDNYQSAKKIGNRLNIDKVFSELLPHEKVNKLEEIKQNLSKKEKILFVGDGINDAPVLALSDIGVSMGALGSDAAIEASDVVIMDDKPSRLIQAIKISKKTKRIVMENIVFALGVKFIVLALGAFGIASMWEAVFADVGVAFIAILNSMRSKY